MNLYLIKGDSNDRNDFLKLVDKNIKKLVKPYPIYFKGQSRYIISSRDIERVIKFQRKLLEIRAIVSLSKTALDRSDRRLDII
jgi:hypothetical protein